MYTEVLSSAGNTVRQGFREYGYQSLEYRIKTDKLTFVNLLLNYYNLFIIILSRK